MQPDSKFKRLKFFLQLWDGIWSVPIALSLFLIIGVIIQAFYTDGLDTGGGPGFYDPSFIQAAFYVSAMMVFSNFMVWLGIYFNFRGIFRYFIGKKNEEGVVVNQSKEDFKKLQPWQRIGILFFLYFSLLGTWLLLFRMMV